MLNSCFASFCVKLPFKKTQKAEHVTRKKTLMAWAHVTADYMVCVVDDQWKYLASKCHTAMFLQAFDSPCCGDISLEGGGVSLAPECRLVISSGLICLLELFSGGFSGWTHVTRALSKLDIFVVTALAIDWSDVCVMTNHHTFGAEVVSDDLKLDLN